MSGLFSGSRGNVSLKPSSLLRLACTSSFVFSALGINLGASAQDFSAAAEARATAGVAPVCEIEVAPPEDAEQVGPGARNGVVVALCGGEGVVLGSAERWRSFANRREGAVVVELESLGRKRIMLLQRDSEGRLTSEDIAGTLSLAAGRSAVGGMQGLSARLERFAGEGLIAVEPDASTSARGVDLPAPFSLDDHNRQRQQIVATSRQISEGAVQ